MVIRPTDDLGQESFVGFDSISGGPEWQLHTSFLGPGAYCKRDASLTGEDTLVYRGSHIAQPSVWPL